MQTHKLYAATMMALLGLILWVLSTDASTSEALLAELRLFSLVVVPIVAVTTVFTAFLEWRRGLKDRFLQQTGEYSEAA